MAYYDRSIAYQNLGEKSKAITDLEKCLDLTTDETELKRIRDRLEELR